MGGQTSKTRGWTTGGGADELMMLHKRSAAKMGIEGAVILVLGVICGATSKSWHDIAMIALIQAVYFLR